MHSLLALWLIFGVKEALTVFCCCCCCCSVFLRRFLLGRWKDHRLTRDVPVLTKEGELRQCRVTLSELQVNGTRYFLGLLTDMTELKQSLEVRQAGGQGRWGGWLPGTVSQGRDAGLADCRSGCLAVGLARCGCMCCVCGLTWHADQPPELPEGHGEEESLMTHWWGSRKRKRPAVLMW